MYAAQLVYLAFEVIIILAWLPRAVEGHYTILALAILIPFLAFEHGCYYFGTRSALEDAETEARFARNRRLWEEYERVRDDPRLLATPDKWPECLLKDYLNDPIYKARVQELIDRSR